MPSQTQPAPWRFADIPIPAGAIVTDWGGIIDPGLNFLHPVPAAGAAYWRGKLGADGRLPGRNDIDPMQLRAILGHVTLMERDRAGGTEVGRLRVRLIGTVVVDHLGELTGRWLDEALPPESLQRFNDPAAWRLRHRAPSRLFQRSIFRDRTWVIAESFSGPLASDGVNIDMFFGVHATWAEDNPPPDVVAATEAWRASRC